jgi:tryptophan synthase alpha chain
MLECYLEKRRRQRDILLMTHVVMGHPDFDTSLRLVDSMVSSGVDLIEMQLPTAQPVADGPVIARAHRQALARGASLERCFEMAGEVARRFDIPFLLMSYYQQLSERGVSEVVELASCAGLVGAIVPDVPAEGGARYLREMRARDLSPIQLYSPATQCHEMRKIGENARGFLYCVARRGLTGERTEFSDELSRYLARARAATHLPLAVGFGVRSRDDVSFLRGKADIAVIGTQTLRVLQAGGLRAVAPFLSGLRS